MNCQITQTAATELWPSLLRLKARCAARGPAARDAFLVKGADSWDAFDESPRDAATATVVRVPLQSGAPLFERLSGHLDDHHATFLRLYLPLIVGQHRARIAGVPFITGHLAQTLDGRIACATGHSQWIGNEANLHHAHRLRALHDGILVGGHTVETDDPRLTVRHVPGDDPRRFILSGRGHAWRQRPEAKVFQSDGSTLLCASAALPDLPPVRDSVTVIGLPAENGRIDIHDVNAAIAATGTRSLFVEGGGATLSSFLDAGLIDILHLHVAPRILGSGVNGFRLPEVKTINEGPLLHMTHYELEGELLFECRCPSRAPISAAIGSATP